MRKQVFTSITMLGLFLTLAVASVNAQSRTKIEVTVSFDFTAGNANLPAGEYSAQFVSHTALALRSADGKKCAVIVASRAIRGDKNKPEGLVFHRYGERYFLAQIWMLRTDSGRELHPSSTERRLAKKRNLGMLPERIAVAARAK